jgi:hypothetical protein
MKRADEQAIPTGMLLLLACAAQPPGPGAPDPETGDGAPFDTAPEHLPDAGPGEESDPSAAVFDEEVIHDISLTMDVAAWADLSGNPWAETWHTATFTWSGETVGNVSVRAFGFSSHVVGKPPIKIDFDREVPGQEWRGLEQLKLKNSYYDPGFLHEALAPWLLRRAGVPASRTGWARVSVNGTYVGLYIVTEPVDDRFLVRHFGNDDGPLWSIDGIRGHGLMPLTDPLAYFQTNTSVESDGADLVEATRVVAEGSDAELAATFDLDAFFTESIVRTMSGSQDSFSADGNNFYLYNDPEGRWEIIPWDFNFDFSAFGVVPALEVDPARPWATSDYAMDPYSGQPYVDVLMERQVASGRSVTAEIEALADGAFAWTELVDRVESWRELVRDDALVDPMYGGAAFDTSIANDLLLLHLKLSNTLGREVATCEDFGDVVLARDLAPTGRVGWSRLTTDGWGWDDGTGRGCVTAAHACIGFQVARTHACTGLFAHAPSDVKIQVPEGRTHLQGAAGLQLFGADCSDGARFEVRQGGATLWSSAVLTSYSEPEPFEVAVSPGEVQLITDDLGANGCDMTAWLDLRAR